MISDDAVRVLNESEMEAIVGGTKPPAAGDPTSDD